ncbi:MAG TPA: M43 family zinc metalloprotease [Chitinophagaceae bacterium]|nr:M43 family zinc metalloprotease [Chitinophagaceae bacterium]
MRTLLLLQFILLVFAGPLLAQRDCSSQTYLQQELLRDPLLKNEINRIENFVQNRKASRAGLAAKPQGARDIVKIPVVVHILYHRPEENMSDEKVFTQIRILNEIFRRLNADTVNTPDAFRSVAADCEIEFQLATSDPQRRSTTGIIRKYTPVTLWNADDRMKVSAEAGDDAWDTNNYLNIWVCNMGRVAGYSSFPGGPVAKDGIVVAFNVFGNSKKAGYELGKTAVHEVGHWLGLRHIWGDSHCGNDMIDDTPYQSSFTSGCPKGIRNSCNNGAGGDMYMNYMDLTLDACTNLFTEGQKERMWAAFEAGGGRNSLLTSYGLEPPLINEIPVPDEAPKWFAPHLYPNPASGEMTLNLAYDARWIGKTINVTNTQGQIMMTVAINAKILKVDVSSLRPGLYFLSGKKDDGSVIKLKFIKL